MNDIQGLLFDKDGTLFDFQSTWGRWGAKLVLDLAKGDESLADVMAESLGLDRAAGVFHPESFVIAGTNREIVAALAPLVLDMDAPTLSEYLVESSTTAVAEPAVSLRPLLERLIAEGFALGVATNDSEVAAEAQLSAHGILEMFDFVVGADSGHGEKPGPGQCLAFAETLKLDAAQVAMIGDSTHDLHAGRAAGMATVAVLTGPAGQDDLAPFADVVLPDIGHLPSWLGLAKV